MFFRSLALLVLTTFSLATSVLPARSEVTQHDLTSIVSICPNHSKLTTILENSIFAEEFFHFEDGAVGFEFMFNGKNFLAIFMFDEYQDLQYFGITGLDEPETYNTYLPDLTTIATNYANSDEPDYSYKHQDEEVYSYVWPTEGCMKALVITKNKVKNSSMLVFFVR